jgi:hypothetical protein
MGYHYVLRYMRGDIDRDWDVDWRDFTILANQWQQIPGVPSADVAPAGGDGIVNWHDVAVLAENWLARVE